MHNTVADMLTAHLAPEDKAHLVLYIIKSKQSAAALCRKHRISQSCYYAWRKIFFLAGTDALRRSPKRASRTSVRERSKHEDKTRKNTEKRSLTTFRLLRVLFMQKMAGPDWVIGSGMRASVDFRVLAPHHVRGRGVRVAAPIEYYDVRDGWLIS
jgi:transposase-like protein